MRHDGGETLDNAYVEPLILLLQSLIRLFVEAVLRPARRFVFHMRLLRGQRHLLLVLLVMLLLLLVLVLRHE